MTNDDFIASVAGLIDLRHDLLTLVSTLRKSLLVEAANFGDLTSDKYLEIQKRVDSALQSVNPLDEYRDFSEKHR